MAVANVLPQARKKEKKKEKRELVKSERLRLERSSVANRVGSGTLPSSPPAAWKLVL